MLYTLEKPKPLIDFPHITHHCRLEKCSSADIRTCSLQKTHKCREIYKCSQRAWVCIRRPWWRVQLNYRYTLYIVAKDHGSPPNDNIVTVIIHVLDENDNPPRFLNNSFFVNVQEKLPVGTVVTSVTAKDIDAGNNGEVRYTIDQGNSGSVFQINATSWVITLQKQLDFERKNKYLLRVVARDQGQNTRSSFLFVTVYVLDSNDNMPSTLN